MIAYIDTEVSTTHKQATDFGAVRDDGEKIHTHVAADFGHFVAAADTLCGHNIIHHDLKYLTPLRIAEGRRIVDTLYLSPLLFPKKPYHRLLKDDKLQVDELNNPLNDAMKAERLFHDEVAAWRKLPEARRAIFYHLLLREAEFEGFFDVMGERYAEGDLPSMIVEEFGGKICSHANLRGVVQHYPVELSYTLAVVGADDIQSLTPAWVMRNYPKVGNVQNLLLNTPCQEGCEYCHHRLDAHQGLKDFFGYDEFRRFDGVPMQQQAVEATIKGESLLTIFPTGGGKSLTFQLPALMAGRNSHGLTVVISPLQSLMKDQVDNLTDRGISDAVTINGLLDPIERAEAIEQVANGSANLLYIAPEMLRSSTIQRLLLGRNVVRFVIDEAHCFSAWGHDFRVDYLYIGDFIRQLQEKKSQLGPIAVSCFTATAKQKVITDIADYFKQKLGLELKIFAASAERKNLQYSVLHCDTDGDKYNQLRNLILGNSCPTIVYVSRTKKTHELSHRLNTDGIEALPFNGRMEASDKVKSQEAFMQGRVQVIVATSAFGMGVDKKDVGLVVHYDISDSLENYVQEAGRAGRDPQMEAQCYVLYGDNDLDKHFILLNQTKLSISEIQQVWKAIKDLTPTNTHLSCSPLEIARQAGWDEEVVDIETRVKSALAALEEAGYIERGNNVPHIFATGITVNNMDEARNKLTLSPLFDNESREEAARIIRSLISQRATAGTLDGEAESRVDYLADILGLSKESVIRNVNLMREAGLLSDTLDMKAWIAKSTILKELEQTLKLEQFVIGQLSNSLTHLNYKEVNEAAQKANISSNVRRIRTLLYFLSVKDYIRKEEHTAAGSVSIQLQTSRDNIMERFERRTDICRFVVEELYRASRQPDSPSPEKGQASPKELVNFSLVSLLKKYQSTHSRLLFGSQKQPTQADFEEALLYLSKNSLLKIEGGFMVTYNSLQLNRKADRHLRYNKEHYRMLDEFYKQRIQQIHIVGKYANLMVEDYNAALQFVSDYFRMDFRKFIAKYFKGESATQIKKNITPKKFKDIFGTLDDKQKEIIEDSHSRYIVVAAGPGSGKTLVLVHKLASLLLMEDVKHEQLLMLTFSRSAATEFKQRLMKLIGNAAHYVDIKTFHSYSFDLLGQNGNLNDASDVVGRAAAMTESGEVEERKIAKSVLVIDEAQDMGADDYHLVRALMSRNEDMRVIAVGDDDQNIYGFRGSNSAYLRSLVDEHGATLYEMTTNYRSARSIVAFANQFAHAIPHRMKQTPTKANSKEEGRVEVHLYDQSDFATTAYLPSETLTGSGTTCILTTTNEEALQLSYLLQQRGLHTQLIQSLGNFSLMQLAEVRYFLKHLSLAPSDGTISNTQWVEAKAATTKKYNQSADLPVLLNFFSIFEETYRTIYYSDLREYLYESSLEDFISPQQETILLSTIHKAKGREFDTVHLIDTTTPTKADDPEVLRAKYVGITRAKRTLYIHTANPAFGRIVPPVTHHVAHTKDTPISIALTHHDVVLSHFKPLKNIILSLQSGAPLTYRHHYLFTMQGQCIIALSKKMCSTVDRWEDKGYHVTEAEIGHIVAWKPKDEQEEYAVCLANIHLMPSFPQNAQNEQLQLKS